MAKPALLVHPPLGMFEARLADYDVVHWPTDRQDVRAAVTIGSVGVSNDMIDALPELGAIICFGVGVDGVDLDYARERGIAVTHGREINNEDVADVAFGLIIATVRGFSEAERVLRDDRWTPPLAIASRPRLYGRKQGIVGMGAIGQAIARRAQGFGMDIKWNGPRAKPDIAQAYEPDLTKLAAWADILAVAARGDQPGLIDAGVIAALGEQGYLVNISRGSVVDESAVIAALKTGAVGGAGKEEFAQEPTPAQS